MSTTTPAPPSYSDASPDEDELQVDDHQPHYAPDPPEDYDSDSSGYDSPPHEYEVGDIRHSRALSPPSSLFGSKFSDNISTKSEGPYSPAFDVEDQMLRELHDTPIRRRISPIYKCLIGTAIFSLLVVGSVVINNKHRTSTLKPLDEQLDAENAVIEVVPPSAESAVATEGSNEKDEQSSLFGSSSENLQDAKVDSAAAATIEQSTPATTKPTTIYVPKDASGDIDLGQWCGDCAAGPPGVNCDQRVNFLGKHYKTEEVDAKTSLMESGKCHIKTAAELAVERPTYPCRKTPEDQGGKEGTEKFCGYCRWQSSDFDCFTRLEYLMNHYHQTELQTMQGLLKGNQCVLPENYMEEFNQDQQDGTEDWCGYCTWGDKDHHKCEDKLAMYTASGEKTILTVKKEILENGHCKKQPLCDANSS